MTKAKSKRSASKKSTAESVKSKRKSGAAKTKAPQVFNVDKYLNNLVAPVFDAKAAAAKFATDVSQRAGEMTQRPAEVAELVRERLEVGQDQLSEEFRGLLERLAQSAPVRFVDETAADSQKRAREQMDAALGRVGLMRIAEHERVVAALEKKAARSKKSALSRQKKRLESAKPKQVAAA